jgi:hypothetical protein
MANAYCIAWHPVKKTLAIGFSSIKKKIYPSFFLKRIVFPYVRW